MPEVLWHTIIWVFEKSRYSLDVGKARIWKENNENSDRIIISGSHNAYEGIKVQRTIASYLGSGTISGRDEYTLDDTYTKPLGKAYLLWHAGEGVDIHYNKDSDKAIFSTEITNTVLEIQFFEDIDCKVYRAVESDEMILGWSFPKYSVKVPIDSLKCQMTNMKSTEWEITVRKSN